MKGPIRGLGVINQGKGDIYSLQHIIVDETGMLIVDGCSQKEDAKPRYEAQVPTTKALFMAQNRWSEYEVAIGSKDTLLQLWDVNHKEKKAVWQARNLPNDELDLQVPIYDTDGFFIDKNHVTVCTGYGDVREYDIRGQRRPIFNTKVSEMMLTNIVHSKLNDNIVYAAN